MSLTHYEWDQITQKARAISIELLNDNLIDTSHSWTSQYIAYQLLSNELGSFAKADVTVVTEGLGNIALTGLPTIHGYTLLGNGSERVAVTDNDDPVENGIYLVPNGGGDWGRSHDFNIFIEGQVQAGTWFFVSDEDDTFAKYRFFVLPTNFIFRVGEYDITFGYSSPLDFSTLPDSSITVKGVLKLSVPPVIAGNPIAVGDNDPRNTDSRPPNGAAGGDLSGTYPNPVLVSIVSAATKGSASKTVTFTIDAKGRVTALTDQDIQITEAQVTNLTSDLAAKQPLDSTLTALAAYNTNGIIVQTAADTFVGRALTAGTGIAITNPDGVAGNPVISSSFGVGSYSNVTASRAFATNYTPNATRATYVVATFKLACDDGETSNVDVLVAGASIGHIFNDFEVSGLLGVTGTGTIDIPISFIVPPNTVYRFNNTVAGTETISKVVELTL